MGFPNVDSFNGASPSATPVGASVAKGAAAPRPAAPSAKGKPALAQSADGTANLRVNYQCFEGGDSRAQSSSGRGTRAAVDRFNDSGV